VTKSRFRKARELERPPKRKLKADIMKMLNALKESQNGGFEGYSKKHNWTHKSCLWELPYAKALILPHNIDLMHLECNVAESIISMCFDVTSFSKDNVNARKDLATLCNRSSLEPKRNAKENLKRPRAPYYLKPTERKEILRWLKKLKFKNCYASNIKQAVNVSTSKLNRLKSHDYHIIIEILILVMFRGYFNTDLWKIFTELSYFYR
jgi:mRNA-degrading endonuclease RelE of RelBE toxin-antitoxin system